MIDLESIAESRARELDQSERDWVEALRQPAFASFSTYLSDGEIERYVLSFDSPTQLIVVSGLFLKVCQEGLVSAYQDFLQTSSEMGLDLRRGLELFMRIEGSYENRHCSFHEKLDLLKESVKNKR